MRRKAVTIRSVAQQAQVSISTVSQILNGNSRYVSADKRERVLRAAEELQYRPNAIARSMVKQRTATVGMVFTSVVDHLFIHTMRRVQTILGPEGYTIFLADTPDIESEMQAITALQDRQVDGFIFVSMTSVSESAHLLRLKEAGVPLVVINRPLGQDCDLNQIHWNDWEAGYLATRHLLSLGHTYIATISGPLQGLPHWQVLSIATRAGNWLWQSRGSRPHPAGRLMAIILTRVDMKLPCSCSSRREQRANCQRLFLSPMMRWPSAP